MLKRLLRLSARLYPAAWLERYGEEFRALLDGVTARWCDLFDVWRGVLVMQASRGRFLKVTALAGLAGLVVALAIPFARPLNSSMATIKVRNTAVLPFVNLLALKRAELAEIMKRYDLYHEDVYRKPMETIVAEMRNRILIVRDPKRDGVVRIQFEHPDRAKAHSVVRDLAALYEREYRRFYQSSVEFLETTGAPPLPVRNIHMWMLAAGLGIGLMTGVLIQQPLRWTLKVVGFASAGLAAALCLAWFIPDTYISNALVTSKTAAHSPAGILTVEIKLPPKAPKMYFLSAVDRDARRAQSTLRNAVEAMRTQAVEVIDAPSLPIKPANHQYRDLIAVCGMMIGFAIGAWRMRSLTLA